MLKPFVHIFAGIALFAALNAQAQEVVADSSSRVLSADTLVSAPDTLDMVADSAVKRREPPFKSRVTYKASDSVKFAVRKHKIYLYKEAQVNYEKMELTAYRQEFDMDTRVVHAGLGQDSTGIVGKPLFKQGSGEPIESDSLSYNFNTSKGIIHGTSTKEGENILLATKAKRYKDGHIDLQGGKMTTCDDPHPHFYLALSKAKMIPGNEVVFGPAHMVLLDVPLPIILPFGFFPQNNKKAVSGVLVPSIGIEVSRGLSATNGGYYFAFSDNFDATVRGDIYSTGTWKINLTPRYVKRYKYSGNLNFNYGITVSGEKGLDQTKTKQYSIQWTHSQDAKANPNQNFSASVNYSSTSYDKEYNYTNPSNLYTNTKNSSISYRKNWPNTPFRLTANFNHSQSMQGQTEIITFSFPTVNFGMDRIYPFRRKEGAGKKKWYEDVTLQYDANIKNSLNIKEGQTITGDDFKNMPNGFQHKIPFSINFKALKFFNITPSMNYTGVMYTKRLKWSYQRDEITATGQRGVEHRDTIYGVSYAHSFAPSLSVSANPKFYLMNIYGPNSKVEAIRTVISPTVSASYVPDLNSIFHYDRYYYTYTDNNGREVKRSIYDGSVYGTPAVPGQSGSVSVGLNGNVEMKVRDFKDSVENSRKVKLLDRIDARSSYNVFADSMKWSNISLSASTTIAGINLTASGTVNPYKLTPAGTRIDKFGPQLTNINFNTGISLPFKKKDSKTGDNKTAGDDKTAADKAKEKVAVEDYTYFDVPWNLTISYSLGYSKPTFEGKFTQNLNFSGSINFTKNWQLSFQSAYDFDAKKISYMTANITRDLHCWTMSLNFAPFGTAKYFFFTINVKSSTLHDLKYEKRKSQSDFARQPQW